MPIRNRFKIRPRRAAWLLAAACTAGAGLAAHGAAAARCSAHGVLPDPACTPGATFVHTGVAQICRPGYSRSVRNVSSSLRRRVFAEYGILRHPRGTYEVDHLVPLELGGSNAIANLWPQPASTFHDKDRLENVLHDRVCAGELTLARAQQAIREDWHAAFLRYARG